MFQTHGHRSLLGERTHLSIQDCTRTIAIYKLQNNIRPNHLWRLLYHKMCYFDLLGPIKYVMYSSTFTSLIVLFFVKIFSSKFLWVKNNCWPNLLLRQLYHEMSYYSDWSDRIQLVIFLSEYTIFINGCFIFRLFFIRNAIFKLRNALF